MWRSGGYAPYRLPKDAVRQHFWDRGCVRALCSPGPEIGHTVTVRQSSVVGYAGAERRIGDHVMLSDRARPVVEATLPVVGAAIPEIADRFYRLLFTEHPELL